MLPRCLSGQAQPRPLPDASCFVAVGPAGAAPELVAGVFAVLRDALSHRLAAFRAVRRIASHRMSGIAGGKAVFRQVFRETAMVCEAGM